MMEGDGDYHPRCARKLFGSAHAPLLPYTRKDLDKLARIVVEITNYYTFALEGT